MPQNSPSPIHPRGRTLASGFGVTLAMWMVAYLAMMNPGLILGEALFGLMLGCLLAAGVVAGRTIHQGESAWLVGAKIGALSATLNLLIIGSLIGGKQAGAQASHVQALFAMWIASAYFTSIFLCALGAAIGARWRRSDGLKNVAVSSIARGPAMEGDEASRWYYRFTVVAAASVFLLLITGGLVTGLQAGLAVPDWPNSFGHNMLLYPVSEMIADTGVYYEHSHRLYGMLVGVTAITLAITMFFFDRRGWLQALAIVFLVMVCAQGILGGTRVTEKSIVLAIFHGVFAQILLATIAAIAAFTSSTWKSALATERTSAAMDRSLSLALFIMLIVQLVLGALYRHMRRDWEMPPAPLQVLYSHMALAAIVTLLSIFVGGRSWGFHRDQPVLSRLGLALMLLVAAQLVLGTLATMAVWSRSPQQAIPVLEVVITSAHQATGALLLTTAALLALWTRRLLLPAQLQRHQVGELRQTA